LQNNAAAEKVAVFACKMVGIADKASFKRLRHRRRKRVNVLLPAPQNKRHRLVRCLLFCGSGGEPLNPAACRNHKICKYSAAAEKNADFAHGKWWHCRQGIL